MKTINDKQVLLGVEDLTTCFPRVGRSMLDVGSGFKAVDEVTFQILECDSFGIIGESGCGKTTLARTITRLVPATSGSVIFDRINVLRAGKKQLRKIRAQMGIIFQNPYTSLNPKMSVGSAVAEPLQYHRGLSGRKLRSRVSSLFSQVGLSSRTINCYPRHLSVGQQQRASIARALALKPRLLICDEPVSSLDVSVQAQVLNLFKDLQETTGLSYLFIAHDLPVVYFICDFVAVMHRGKIVETGPTRQLRTNPLHPYTRALISATLGRRTDACGGRLIQGGNFEGGCSFHNQCAVAESICVRHPPKLQVTPGSSEQYVACWKYQ